MINFSQRALSWSREYDGKIRAWMDQFLGLKSYASNLALARTGPWRSVNLDVDFDQAHWLLRWSDFRFRTRVRLGEAIYKSFAHLSRQWLKAEIHSCEISAGKVRYWKTDNGHSERILFFHGFGDSMDGAYPLAHHLVSRYDFIVPDLPGFGESFKRNDLPHNYDSYRRWLGEFLEAAEVGPVHVIGNSLGGAFSMMLAQMRPDLIKSLTLLNSAAVSDFRASSLYDELLAGQVLFQIKTHEELDAFWKRVFEKAPYLPPFVRDYFLHRFRENHDWYGYLLREIFSDIRHRRDPRFKELFFNQHLPSLKVPSLIIWGAEDRLFPLAFGKRAHQLLRNSRLVVLEGVGHVPQVEAPAVVAKHLSEFIEGLAKK